MKEYISPILEIVIYETEECLTGSGDIEKNGEYNIEFKLPEWNDDVI